MTYLQFSPLYPLKGRIAANISLFRLAANTPLRACPDFFGRAEGEYIRQQIITITW